MEPKNSCSLVRDGRRRENEQKLCYFLFWNVCLVQAYSVFRCHVMEVESFEDEEVAKLLKDSFVSIKVRV